MTERHEHCCGTGQKHHRAGSLSADAAGVNHGLILGMVGSGKTALTTVAGESAVTAGVPRS